LNDQMQSGMAEATRLTREGRLDEATAAIQRALGGRFAPGESSDVPGEAKEPIQRALSAVNETAQPTTPSQPGRTEHALRRAPSPSRRFRSVSSLLGTAPGVRPDHSTPSTVSAGGRFLELSFTNRAGTRAYKLYIPRGYVGQEVPLIVMLHGCTQSPDDIAAGTHMNALAEEHTFLVAYPAQA